jgi:hypothetical protein
VPTCKGVIVNVALVINGVALPLLFNEILNVPEVAGYMVILAMVPGFITVSHKVLTVAVPVVPKPVGDGKPTGLTEYPSCAST